MFEFDDDDLDELLRESLFGASASTECFCTKCGEYVTDAEFDFDHVMHCETCDEQTRVQSPLRFHGYI